jgi:hypothetical protein
MTFHRPSPACGHPAHRWRRESLSIVGIRGAIDRRRACLESPACEGGSSNLDRLLHRYKPLRPPAYVTSFRNSIAVLLVAWLTILSQVAVAMPFCEHARAQELLAAAQAEHTDHSSAELHHPADCPQHHEHRNKRGDLRCDACALCQIACNVMPSLSADLVIGPFARVYFPASDTSAVSFVPETPQPVPVAIPS